MTKRRGLIVVLLMCLMHLSYAGEGSLEPEDFCYIGVTESDIDGMHLPDVQTFDGYLFNLFTADRFLLARSLAPYQGNHPCKFQVTAYSEADANGVWLHYLSVSFDTPDTQTFGYDVNFKISYKDNQLKIRGRDVDNAVIRDFPYTYSDEQGEVLVTADKGRDADNNVIYTVEGGAVGYDCRWRVVLNEPDADGKEHALVYVNSAYGGLMEGLCGDNNNRKVDDSYGCGLSDYQPNTAEGWKAISDSCIV